MTDSKADEEDTMELKMDESEEGEESEEDLFAGEEEDHDEDKKDDAINSNGNHSRKRRKLGNGSSIQGGTPIKLKSSSTEVDPELVEHAKKRLSKWAARLFDPNRPRGLVEPPKTIPLNDEFLAEFGKREKDYDEATGRSIELDETINDNDDENAWGSGNDDTAAADLAKKESSKNNRKIKITNLNFQTSAAKLEQACENFGALEEVKLILDKDRQGGAVVMNSGRAYVTFEHEESATACIEGLTQLDGRTLRLARATSKPAQSGNRKSLGGGPGGGGMPRYWEKDISTKCFRCGGVGHIEPNCTNAPKARPCPLCANIDHDMRACPLTRVCFNCGIPGHVSRECPHQRGLPQRLVCGICFRSGHHRLQCRSRPTDAPSEDAICMVCGELGHFLCKDMKWFFGLDGVSCFNCGGRGHNGYDCRRPNLFQLIQDQDLANQEIERAEANSLAEELEKQRTRGRQMDRSHDDKQRGRGRGGDRGNHRSVPAPYTRGGSNESLGHGDDDRRRQSNGGGGGGGRRDSGGGGGGDNRRQRQQERRGYR